jgi:hypothetical protein
MVWLMVDMQLVKLWLMIKKMSAESVAGFTSSFCVMCLNLTISKVKQQARKEQKTKIASTKKKP